MQPSLHGCAGARIAERPVMQQPCGRHFRWPQVHLTEQCLCASQNRRPTDLAQPLSSVKLPQTMPVCRPSQQLSSHQQRASVPSTTQHMVLCITVKSAFHCGVLVRSSCVSLRVCILAAHAARATAKSAAVWPFRTSFSSLSQPADRMLVVHIFP